MNINILKMELQDDHEEKITQDNPPFKNSLIYNLSDEEIKERFKEIFSDIFLNTWCDTDVSIDRNDNYIIVEVFQMYKYIDLKAKHLVDMCQMFNTDQIEIEEDSYGGCYTCDYGSKYTRSFKFY